MGQILTGLFLIILLVVVEVRFIHYKTKHLKLYLPFRTSLAIQGLSLQASTAGDLIQGFDPLSGN